MMTPEHSKHTLCGLYVLVLLLVLLNFHFIAVASHPLTKASGTKFKRSSYRHPYNGFLNYRSLNLSAPETVSSSSNHWSNQFLTTEVPENSNWRDTSENVGADEREELSSTHQLIGSSSSSSSTNDELLTQTSSSETSSSETSPPSDLTTLPQMEVVSKTIDDEWTNGKTNGGKTNKGDGTVAVVERDVVPSVDAESTDKGDSSEDSPPLPEDTTEHEALEADNNKGGHASEIDIFDNLMAGIHNHWLDFVSKMKLSVVDVWKSISNHMMDRLETFAVSI